MCIYLLFHIILTVLGLRCSLWALCCGAWACLFSSCVQAELPHGMWDLSSPTGDPTGVPCIGRWILNHWTAREVPRCIFKERKN